MKILIRNNDQGSGNISLEGSENFVVHHVTIKRESIDFSQKKLVIFTL